MCVKYWCQYVTQKELSYEFDVCEVTIHDIVVWVEYVLIGVGNLVCRVKSPYKKRGGDRVEVVLVGVVESSVECFEKTKKGVIVVKRNVVPKKHG